MEADHILRLCAGVAGGGLGHAMAEVLAAYVRIDGSDGFPFSRWAAFFGAGCAATVVAALAIGGPIGGIVLLAFVLGSAVAELRLVRGVDGATQMMRVVLGGVAAAFIANDEATAEAALVFIAAQATLAYVFGGLFKALSPAWRSGRALVTILALPQSGAPEVASWLSRRPFLMATGSWAVIGWECGWALVALGPPELLWLWLGTGAAFHLANARLLGLTSFPAAFGAAYPALWYVNQRWF